jgi:hypothetical protein
MKNESDNQTPPLPTPPLPTPPLPTPPLPTPPLPTPPLPTHAELMQIAINLTRTPNASPDSLVCAALSLWKNLWQSAEKVIGIEKQIQKQDREIIERIVAIENSLPQPTKFPISRDEFFGIMLSSLKSHPTERAETAKAHIRDMLRIDLNPSARVMEELKIEPTDDDVNKAYAKFQPIETLLEFQQEAVQFNKFKAKRVSVAHSKQLNPKGKVKRLKPRRPK